MSTTSAQLQVFSEDTIGEIDCVKRKLKLVNPKRETVNRRNKETMDEINRDKENRFELKTKGR